MFLVFKYKSLLSFFFVCFYKTSLKFYFLRSQTNPLKLRPKKKIKHETLKGTHSKVTSQYHPTNPNEFSSKKLTELIISLPIHP